MLQHLAGGFLLLGARITVPTLDGKQLQVKVPAGTQAGARLRLKGHGLPSGPRGQRGDLYVSILPVVPKHRTPEQKRLVEQRWPTPASDRPPKV